MLFEIIWWGAIVYFSIAIAIFFIMMLLWAIETHFKTKEQQQYKEHPELRPSTWFEWFCVEEFSEYTLTDWIVYWIYYGVIWGVGALCWGILTPTLLLYIFYK